MYKMDIKGYFIGIEIANIDINIGLSHILQGQVEYISRNTPKDVMLRGYLKIRNFIFENYYNTSGDDLIRLSNELTLVLYSLIRLFKS